MKKICLISDKNTYMKRFCWLLAENGYQVALVCRHKKGLGEDQFPPEVKFFQLSSTSFLKKLREIFKIINEFNPDIVHTHYLVKDCLIPALKLNRKYKYYISIWGSDINTFSANIVNRIIQNLGLLLCDKFHLLSPYFEQKIQNLYFFLKKHDYAIFSWGVDYRFLSNPNPIELQSIKNEFLLKDNDFIILSYRNHTQIYNHHTLIKSIPTIIEKFPNAKFIFTRGSNDKDYTQRTFRLVEESGIGKNFIFIDRWLSNEELRSLINIADINVSIPTSDGLPASLFEIMSTKSIPVISDLVNYHPFFTDNINGFYLKDTADNHELERIISATLKDITNLKNKFCPVNNAYIQEKQDWEKQSKLFLDFYN
jgi:glycosyltransferase involved in cell wall biosynthesis